MKYFGGCDVGSTYTKAVILDENGKLAAHTTIRSKINSEVSARMSMEEVISQVPELKTAEDLCYPLTGEEQLTVIARAPISVAAPVVQFNRFIP